MSAPFDVGDVVVCVNVAPAYPYPRNAAACARLRAGKEYRVQRLGNFLNGLSGIDIGVGNADIFPNWRDLWGCDRFRKIDDTVTEAFRETLRKLPAKEREDA